MPEWLVVICMAYMYAVGFVTAWAYAHDGKSPFWTSYVDITTLRCLWK